MLRDQADVIDANARRKKDHRHALQNSGRPVSSMLYYSVFIMDFTNKFEFDEGDQVCDCDVT